MKIALGLCVAATVWCLYSDRALASDRLLKTEDVRIRDPFIYADHQTKTYYMYAALHCGVGVYASRDLTCWKQRPPVLELPESDDIHTVWAPEMHEYKGKYYLFVTLTYKKKLPVKKPVSQGNWPEMHVRGTHVFHADSPLGPFKPFKKASHTPEGWMALDGTLFVEEDTPYMVFCHEWVQTIDGTMDYIPLKDDLSDTVGKPQLMFRASSAPGARQGPEQGKITDGCFLYRSPRSGRLFMIWSTFIVGKGYSVVLTHSKSGTIRGPWKSQELIYAEDGGHGMLFTSFDNHLMMALHQPNGRGKERLHLFRMIDNGESLEVDKEENLR